MASPLNKLEDGKFSIINNYLVIRRPIGLANLNIYIYIFNKGLWYMSFTIYIYFICHLWCNLGKDIVKRATQVRGHSLKKNCMLERSQRNHNNLDCHEFF